MGDAESRRLARRKSLKRARLVLGGKGGFGIDCLIVDINSRGARLRFKASLAVENEIELLFIPECISVSGWVAWQNDCEIGVEFTKAQSWLKNLDTSDPGKIRANS